MPSISNSKVFNKVAQVQMIPWNKCDCDNISTNEQQVWKWTNCHPNMGRSQYHLKIRMCMSFDRCQNTTLFCQVHQTHANNHRTELWTDTQFCKMLAPKARPDPIKACSQASWMAKADMSHTSLNYNTSISDWHPHQFPSPWQNQVSTSSSVKLHSSCKNRASFMES